MIEFTAWPEMLAWPYLMLNGWLPYRDIAIAHSPLLLLDLALFFSITGVGVIQLKIYTWILIAINAYITFFVSNKYWGNKVGTSSSLLYLILCIVYQGNGLWFDLALAPFALLLYLFVKDKKYLYAGIIFALGLLTKQTFVWFVIPVLLSKINLKKFAIGGLIIGLIFLISLLIFGILDDFYYWAVRFGIFYLPSAEGQVLLPSFKQLAFALAPFSILLLKSEFVPWILAGVMGVYPRWELFHFQPALPFLAISISLFLFSNKNKLTRCGCIIILVLFIVIGIKRQLVSTTRFFEPEVHKLVESVIKLNPKEIYVANYWDSIYTLTGSIPVAKPLIPYIPWYLSYDNNKEKIMNGLEDKMPAAIIIGERDSIFPELYVFVDKHYTCNIVEKKVELCRKN